MSDRCPRCGSETTNSFSIIFKCGSLPESNSLRFKQSDRCRIRQLEGLLRECAALVFLPDAVKDKIEKTLEEK